MKKIITFFLLCVSMNSYSQKYKMTYFGNIHTNFCDSEGYTNENSFSTVTLNNDLILQAKCLAPQNVNQVKIINYKPNKVTFIMEYKYYLGGYETERETEIINLNLNHCDSWSGGFVSLNNSLASSSLNFIIEPIINIVPPSVDPSCSVLISADELGFESDIYNWEFQTLTDEWKPLPNSFQGKPNFGITLTDLFGANADNYNNQTINFRIRYCQTKFTNIVSFTFIPCSPLLQNDPPIVSNPSCNNTPTGSINLKFQSPIKNDEQLLLNLFTNDSPPKFLYGKFVKKSLIINNEYIWTNIGAGNYIIRYQAQKTTDNTEDVNSSAVTSKAFSIVNPLLFSFSATETQPKCYGEKGTITITAAGGTPPYYYYLNNDQKMEFTSPKTIDVDAGNNYIKVVDDKDCVDNNKYD